MKRAIALVFVIAVCGTIFGQSFTVQSPNGGEKWRTKSEQVITWIYSDIADTAKVRLLLFRNGTKLGMIADNVPIGINGTGKYSDWLTGAYYDNSNNLKQAGVGGGYKVRIRRVSSAAPYGESAGEFTIFSVQHIIAIAKKIEVPAKHSSGYLTVLFNYVFDLDEGKAYYSKNASNGTSDFWWSKNSQPPHQYMLIPDVNTKCMKLEVSFADATKSYLKGHTGNMSTNPIVSQTAPINMVVGYETNQGRVGVLQVMNVGVSNDQLALKWVTYEN